MIPRLPSDTVTFLFTDIEGSTKLLHELGPRHYSGTPVVRSAGRITPAAPSSHDLIREDS
jgi:class 3 adenylate cyclase